MTCIPRSAERGETQVVCPGYDSDTFVSPAQPLKSITLLCANTGKPVKLTEPPEPYGFFSSLSGRDLSKSDPDESPLSPKVQAYLKDKGVDLKMCGKLTFTEFAVDYEFPLYARPVGSDETSTLATDIVNRAHQHWTENERLCIYSGESRFAPSSQEGAPTCLGIVHCLDGSQVAELPVACKPYADSFCPSPYRCAYQRRLQPGDLRNLERPLKAEKWQYASSPDFIPGGPTKHGLCIGMIEPTAGKSVSHAIMVACPAPVSAACPSAEQCRRSEITSRTAETKREVSWNADGSPNFDISGTGEVLSPDSTAPGSSSRSMK